MTSEVGAASSSLMLKSGEGKGHRAPAARPFLFPWNCPRDGGEVDRA